MVITIDILLKICASIAVIGAAIVYIYKTIMSIENIPHPNMYVAYK
jgi:hypothetical protein